MFKFNSIYSQTGSFTINFTPYTFINGIFETEEKEVAVFLRQNANFIEEVEVKEVKEKVIVPELEELKAVAIALGLKPHHKAGIEKLKELIAGAKNVLVSKNTEEEIKVEVE